MSKESGGPAFPCKAYDIERDNIVNEEGMTLRDYFAAKAMQALVQKSYFDTIARLSYEIADAMLKAREA